MTRSVREVRGLGRSKTAIRAAWVAGDTAVSILTNFLLTIVVARAVSPSAFGAFAVGYAIYGLAVTLVQAICGQVLAVRYSHVSGTRHRDAARLALGAAVLIGAAIGIALVVAGLVVSGPLRGVLVILGVFMPGLLGQETWRSIFITRGAPEQAFINDVAWLALLALAIAAVQASPARDASAYLAAWATSALLAAVLGGIQAGYAPRIAGVSDWFGRHREVSLPGLVYNVSAIGAIPLAMLGVSAAAGTTAIAALRGAMALLGPAAVITTAAPTFAVPEIARRDLSPRAAATAAVVLSASMAVVVTIWALVVLAVPTVLGTTLLGETWTSARAVVPAVAVYTVLVQLASGPLVVFRAWNWVHYTVWLGVVQAPLFIAFATVGARVDGGVGAARGLGAAVAVVAPLAWWLLRLAIRRGKRQTSTGLEPDGVAVDGAA